MPHKMKVQPAGDQACGAERGGLHAIARAIRPFRNVMIFFLLLLSFHYFYLWWSLDLLFYPLQDEVLWLFEAIAGLLLQQSLWVLNTLGVEVVLHERSIYFNGMQGFVSVVPECTSLKQWMHWVVIMTFFPGPWRHKLWVIPTGILIIHGVNLLRITGLALIQFPFPGGFHFFHDYVFKTFFYLVIFGMWVVWVEYFKNLGTRI